jgi:hypothetical protein
MALALLLRGLSPPSPPSRSRDAREGVAADERGTEGEPLARGCHPGPSSRSPRGGPRCTGARAQTGARCGRVRGPRHPLRVGPPPPLFHSSVTPLQWFSTTSPSTSGCMNLGGRGWVVSWLAAMALILSSGASPQRPVSTSSCAAKGSGGWMKDGGGAACSGSGPRPSSRSPRAGPSCTVTRAPTWARCGRGGGPPDPCASAPPSSPLSSTPLPPMHQISIASRPAPQARSWVHELGLKGVRRVERWDAGGGGRALASRPMPLAPRVYTLRDRDRRGRAARDWALPTSGPPPRAQSLLNPGP